MIATLTFTLLMNGMNSYDQILLGLFLGSSLALFFHFTIKIHFKYLPIYLSKPQKYFLRKLICRFSGADMNANYHQFYVSLKHMGIIILFTLVLPFSLSALLWNINKDLQSIPEAEGKIL